VQQALLVVQMLVQIEVQEAIMGSRHDSKAVNNG